MVLGSIPGRDKRFSLLRSHPYRLLFNGYRGSVQGVKVSGREFDRSLPSNAQVKIEWSYTSAPPVYPRDMERGALYKTDRCNCRYAGRMCPWNRYFCGFRRTGYSAWTAESLQMKVLLLSLPPRAIHPTAQYNILEDMNPQTHRCKKLSSRICNAI
jgi:hypothetical protein